MFLTKRSGHILQIAPFNEGNIVHLIKCVTFFICHVVVMASDRKLWRAVYKLHLNQTETHSHISDIKKNKVHPTACNTNKQQGL